MDASPDGIKEFIAVVTTAFGKFALASEPGREMTPQQAAGQLRDIAERDSFASEDLICIKAR